MANYRQKNKPMKHIYILLMLLLLSFNSLKGQDYHLFSLENETIFELKNSTDFSCNYSECYFSPVVKNIYTTGTDSVFVFEKTFKKLVPLSNYPGSCLTFADTSFWGTQLTVTDDFTFEFLNIDGETITIQPQKYLSGIWEAYRFQDNSGNYIEAKVTNLLERIIHSDLKGFLIKYLTFLKPRLNFLNHLEKAQFEP